MPHINYEESRNMFKDVRWGNFKIVDVDEIDTLGERCAPENYEGPSQHFLKSQMWDQSLPETMNCVLTILNMGSISIKQNEMNI